jgi:PAS domain S-box-containing protein
VHYASPASARILGGSPETPIRSIDDWTAAIHPDDQDQVRRSVEQGIARGEYEHEYRILRPDGSVRWIRARAWRVPATHGAGALLAGVAEDITDRRELEAQLRQAQKMEGIGQLAGGVAQDFNNLMTVITGYSDLVLESLEPGDANREMLEEILRAGRRAATLTRHLLAFSSRQLLAPKICAMNEIARRASATLASVLGEQVRVVVSLAPDAGSVCVDPDQTEQVLLNLGINARDAMPHGGTLTLETRNVTLRPGDGTGSAGVPPGPYVLLSIADSGIGMSPDIQGHLFEPFFTTKEPGQGRGLGLSTVHGFIRQSGGHIEAESAEGVGSTFRIYLPLADAVAGTEPDGQARDAAQGMKTILLVEDEPAVRSLTSRILQRAGYSVLEAESGEEALEILGTRQDAVHLLLTDLVMPGMSGRAVAERVLALRPSIKVMFMSGYTDDMAVRQGLAEEAVTFLSKPFPPLTLASKVRQVLGG